MAEIQKELLTRPEAAAFLGLTSDTLRRFYAAGIGPRVSKLGTSRTSRVRYSRTALLEWARDPNAYTVPARPEGLPRFEPPKRGAGANGGGRRRKAVAT